MAQLMGSNELDDLLDELQNDGVSIRKLLDLRAGVLENNRVSFDELMRLASLHGHRETNAT